MRAPDGLVLWASSFAVILAVHLGAAAALLVPDPQAPDGLPGDAVSVELAPDPSDQAAPPDEVAGPFSTESTTPTERPDEAPAPEPPAPDAPPPALAEPKLPPPPPVLDAPDIPVPEAAVVLPPSPEPPPQVPPEVPPLEEPPPVPPPDTLVRELEERRTEASQARDASAPALSGGRRPSAAAEATWRGAIGLVLAKNRRYPAEARARGQQGTATVRVTLDADGSLIRQELVTSSGRPALDQEALAMVVRAQPLPKPPGGLPLPIVLTVPVRFSIR